MSVLVVGSAKCVRVDLLRIRALERERRISAVDRCVLVNHAISLRVEIWHRFVHCPLHNFIGATLHPERLAEFAGENRSSVLFHAPMPVYTPFESTQRVYNMTPRVEPTWHDTFGTSGLYGVQLALEKFGNNRPVYLAGIPMDETPHFYDNNTLNASGSFLRGYRLNWEKIKADKTYGLDRVRSASGWTKDLLGDLC